MNHHSAGAVTAPETGTESRFRVAMTASMTLHGGAEGCNRCQEYIQKCHYENRINGPRGFADAVDEWQDHLYTHGL